MHIYDISIKKNQLLQNISQKNRGFFNQRDRGRYNRRENNGFTMSRLSNIHRR